ncbi:sortase-dependent protein [Streptomyces sp. NPDC001544]|uniref:sortase-dependent protein n=1 Tax=Streptomyces sp. NPDC001544 TaxID=3364584 RepID=UPI0036C05D07
MRRTVLSAAALACVAVLAGTVPAFADGTPSPAPSARPTLGASPSPTTGGRGSATREPSLRPSPVPTKVRDGGQVAVVPRGAANTGVASGSDSSGNDGALIGGGVAGAAALGGAAFLVIRRRRVTGA